MTKQIIASMSFDKKLQERIRKSVGELMSDEDLALLIDAAVRDWLLKERHVKDGYHTKILEPLLVVWLKENMQEQMSRVLRAWLAENEDFVKEKFEELFMAGAGQCLAKAMFSLFEKDMNMLRYNIEQKLLNPGDLSS